MTKKYYVVLNGKKTGIFDNRAETQSYVIGFAGAQFKSYENLAEAKKAFEEKNFEKKKYEDWKKFVPIGSVCCDGASSGNPGNMEFQIIDPYEKKYLYKSPIFLDSTNNIGEFLAIVKALNITKDILIFSDSKIALAWVKSGICKTKLLKNEKNKDSFLEIQKAEKILSSLEKNEFSRLKFWNTSKWGENPADFGRK